MEQSQIERVEKEMCVEMTTGICLKYTGAGDCANGNIFNSSQISLFVSSIPRFLSVFCMSLASTFSPLKDGNGYR